jgi:hypothetical protein
MEIQKYDRMSVEDRKDYFGLLLQGPISIAGSGPHTA